MEKSQNVHFHPLWVSGWKCENLQGENMEKSQYVYEMYQEIQGVQENETEKKYLPSREQAENKNSIFSIQSMCV